MEMKNTNSKKNEEQKMVDCTDVKTDVMMQQEYEELIGKNNTENHSN